MFFPVLSNIDLPTFIRTAKMKCKSASGILINIELIEKKKKLRGGDAFDWNVGNR